MSATDPMPTQGLKIFGAAASGLCFNAIFDVNLSPWIYEQTVFCIEVIMADYCNPVLFGWGVYLFDILWKLLNTNFSAALAGALFGALAAGRIARIAKEDEDIRVEMGRARAAIEFAYSITNAGLSFKKQHVKELREYYEEKYAIVHEYERKRQAGELAADAVLDLGELQLYSIEYLKVPIERLEKLVLEEMQVRGRPRPMTVVLRQSIDSFNRAVEMQNSIIENSARLPTNKKVALFFALKRDGMVIEHYKIAIHNLYERLDDVIWFSSTIMDDLVKYAPTIEPKRLFRKRKYVLPNAKFDAEVRKQFPSVATYRDWIKNFRPLIAPTKGRLLGKFWCWALRQWRAFRKGVASIFK